MWGKKQMKSMFDKIEHKTNNKYKKSKKNQVNSSVLSDFSLHEKKAYEIAQVFQNETRKRGDVRIWLPNDSEAIRKSKNFKWFLETWDKYKDEQNFDAYIFIESVFKGLKDGDKIFPAQLKTKKAYEKYREHKMSLKMTKKISTDKKILGDIYQTFKFLRTKIEEVNYENLRNVFFNAGDNYISDGVFYAMQNMLSPFYLSVSRSFHEVYEELDLDIKQEIIDKEDLISIGAFIRMKEEIYDFNKKLFKDDIF